MTGHLFIARGFWGSLSDQVRFFLFNTCSFWSGQQIKRIVTSCRGRLNIFKVSQDGWKRHQGLQHTSQLLSLTEFVTSWVVVRRYLLQTQLGKLFEQHLVFKKHISLQARHSSTSRILYQIKCLLLLSSWQQVSCQLCYWFIRHVSYACA